MIYIRAAQHVKRLGCEVQSGSAGVLDDAGGNGPGDGVFVVPVGFEVVVIIEETGFYDDCRHGRIAEDEEAWPLFNAAVRNIQDGAEVALDAVAEDEALGRTVNEGFHAGGPAVEGVEMEGYEEISIAVIRGVADEVEVVVLDEDDFGVQCF